MLNHTLRLLIGAATLSCWPWAAGATDTVGSEYAVKAAIVYKIAKFVSWPDNAFDSSSEPLSICLPENDPIAPAMNGLIGDAVHGRVIEIRQVEARSLVSADCEVLFISAASSNEAGELISQISRQPILTIGDGDDFNKFGGIISLRVLNNRVRFAINVDASASAGLGISAQLLQLAGMNDGQ